MMLGAVAACLLLCAWPACAARNVEATTSQEDLTSLSIEDLMRIEVTTSSKTATQLSSAASTVYVITSDDICRYGYRTLGECLSRIPGLYVSSDRNYDYIGVRGYARPGDYNTRMLLLVDGHRINDPNYDMAPVGEDLNLDLQSIKRIEVSKGPGSAVWGTNALLAVVNLITKRGSDTGEARTVAGYASHNSAMGYLEYGASSKSGLDVSCSFSTSRSDGQRSIYFSEFDDPATNNGVVRDADAESLTRGYLTASYKGFGFVFSRGGREKTVPTASFGTVFGNDGTYTFDQRTMAELSYVGAGPGSQDSQVAFRVYRDQYQYCGDYIYDYGELPFTVFRDQSEAIWWGGEARYSARISPRVATTVGMEYMRVRRLMIEGHDESPTYCQYIDIDKPFTLASYYAEATVEVSRSLQMVAGCRLDDYSSGVRNWSPRVALIHSLSDSTWLKLMYGRAFRAANNYERNYELQGQYANPALSPEKNNTYELAWEQQIGEHHRLTVSAFHFSLDNIITQVAVPDGLQFQNLGGAKSRGIELGLESMFDNGMTSHFGLAGVHATDASTGARLDNAPRLLASAGVSIPVLSGRLYITPEVRYIAPRRTLSGGSTGASVPASLTIRTNRLFRDYDVNLSVHNLFDQKIFVPAGQEHLQDRIPQDGRTIALSLTRRL